MLGTSVCLGGLTAWLEATRVCKALLSGPSFFYLCETIAVFSSALRNVVESEPVEGGRLTI